MQHNDEFDDPRRQSAISSIFRGLDRRHGLGARGPLFTVVPVVVMIVLLGGILWYSYPREAARQEDAAMPVIRADNTAYKVSPADPGGMNIPYRDSTLFDTLRNERKGEADSRIENLLPAPEEPIDRNELFAGLKTELPPAAVEAEAESTAEPSIETVSAGEARAREEAQEAAIAVTKTADAQAAVPKTDGAASTAVAEAPAAITPPPMPAAAVPAAPATPQPAESLTLPTTAFTQDDVPAATATPQAQEAAAQPPAPVTPSTPPSAAVPASATGDYYVQLGSVKSHEAAESGWKSLQAEFPTQLQNLTLRVQQADLGERGVFHRIQGGPLSQQDAKNICAVISNKGAGACMVVKK